MNFGAEFDDEIFEKPHAKSCKSVPIRQGAKICNPKWFLEESLIDENDPEEVFKCLKYKADFCYFSKKYNEACITYNKCMTMLPATNITGQRECMENLARCYLQQDLPEKALEWALKMHAIAVSSDQKLNSWNLLATICHKLKKYEEELEALHCCLETHKNFPDFWMRLAYCYSGLFKIALPGSGNPNITCDTYCCAFKSRINGSNSKNINSAIKNVCHSINGLSLNTYDISSSNELCKSGNSTTDQFSQICDSPMCSSSKKVSSNSQMPLLNTESNWEQLKDETISKCEMCILSTQVISACLIRTRLLLNNSDHNSLFELKYSTMNKKITECLNHLEIDQLFIEEASKMLKNEMYGGTTQNEISTTDELLCSGISKTTETSDNETSTKLLF